MNLHTGRSKEISMRRLLSLAAAIGLLTLGLSSAPVTASSCEECEEYCGMIPMETGECLRLHCPECAGGASVNVAGPKG
jgi:hypothetical protein